MEIDSKIKNVMANVFEVDLSIIQDDASPNTIKQWTSLKHMNLIIELEEEFAITFNDEQIVSLINFSAIKLTIKDLKNI